MSDGLRLTAPGAGWRLRGVAAVLALALVTTSTLGALLALSAETLAPAVALAAIPAVVVAAGLGRRALAAAMLLSAPALLLVAGLPDGTLAPGAWPGLVASVVRGAGQEIAAPGQGAATPASITAATFVAGGLWTAGAALRASAWRADTGQARLASLLGFTLLGAPWLGALGLGLADHYAWQGAVVLVAGVAWFYDGRSAVMLAVLVALPAAALATVLGSPRDWFQLGGAAPRKPAFRTLEIEPTYGPLTDRRTGATLLVVTAAEPALWRMETLDYTDGSWTLADAALPQLPEPAAIREAVRVRVVSLREDLVVAPGRVVRVSAPWAALRMPGEGMTITPTPLVGSTYHLEAEIVHPTAAQLSRDRAPLDPRARVYTRVSNQFGLGAQQSQSGWLLLALEAMMKTEAPVQVDPRVKALARRLARGARTEWEMVGRVERYLLDGGRFRYTTDVPDPGPQPLSDFLLRSHAGYCQQFAGAAALLLRLAGVPARVAVGFATGRRAQPDQYSVRDLDAHDWIEVYFQGYGWVPFNPTPSADPALIAGGVDPLPAPRTRVRAAPGLDAGATLIAALALGLLLWRCRRGANYASEEWLGRIVRQAGGHVAPSTTFAQMRSLLALRIGPRTAAIASELERGRFAADVTVSRPRPRIRVMYALVGDLGPIRAVCVWARAACSGIPR